MGGACSRIRGCGRKASRDDREVTRTNAPHPPWPAPNDGRESTTLDPVRMPPKQLEAMEKGRHELPPTMAYTVSAAGVPFSSQVNDSGLADVGSGEHASTDEKDERTKDEKRRLSRILSGRASTVRNMTTIVAKKGASRVRILLLLFDSVFRSSGLFNHKPFSCR